MRGSIRQRSKGSWQIRYEGPPDATGTRKYLSETVRGTRKDVEACITRAVGCHRERRLCTQEQGESGRIHAAMVRHLLRH